MCSEGKLGVFGSGFYHGYGGAFIFAGEVTHAERKGEEEQEQKQQEEQPTSLQPKPFVLGDPAQLPARQFVWGHAYPRGVVSVTVAPGGLGSQRQGAATVEATGERNGGGG